MSLRRAPLVRKVFARRCSRSAVVLAALERATARHAATTVVVREPGAALHDTRIVRGAALGFGATRDGRRCVVLDAGGPRARAVHLETIVSVLFHEHGQLSGMLG